MSGAEKQQSAKKRRKSGVERPKAAPAEAAEPEQHAEVAEQQQTAAGAAEPSGWEELEAPQDVQQQAGARSICIARSATSVGSLSA